MRIYIIYIGLFFAGSLIAQNLDVGHYYASGSYRSMAGAGIGSKGTLSTFDLNPAGMVGSIQNNMLSFSQSGQYQSYTLFRHNESDLVLYHANESIEFKWTQSYFRFENCFFGFPLFGNIPVAIGYIKRITPLLSNKCRATTWSNLFNHDTFGHLGAITMATGFQITRGLAIGFTGYGYTGEITSEVKGKRHGQDTDKWATLENNFTGFNIKSGLLYTNDIFGIGMTIETPHSLQVNVDKDLSEDEDYAYLMPAYNQTEWRMPLILGMGFSFTGFKNFLFTVDFESRQYDESDIQLNLYEFGAPPDWTTINIFRTGITFYPFSFSEIPVRLGYAHMPQLYYSNTSTGNEHMIVDYDNTDQVIKRMITLGSTFSIFNLQIDAGLEYSFLKWSRDMDTNFFIEDRYSEYTYKFFTEINFPVS